MVDKEILEGTSGELVPNHPIGNNEQQLQDTISTPTETNNPQINENSVTLQRQDVTQATADGYRRLCIEVLLSGLMERNTEIALRRRNQGGGWSKQKWNNEAKTLSRSAHRWVKSYDFEWWAEQAGVNPNMLRKLTPEQAKEAAFKLRSGKPA